MHITNCGMLPKLLGFPQHKEEEEGMTGILVVPRKRDSVSVSLCFGRGGGGGTWGAPHAVSFQGR